MTDYNPNTPFDMAAINAAVDQMTPERRAADLAEAESVLLGLDALRLADEHAARGDLHAAARWYAVAARHGTDGADELLADTETLIDATVTVDIADAAEGTDFATDTETADTRRAETIDALSGAAAVIREAHAKAKRVVDAAHAEADRVLAEVRQEASRREVAAQDLALLRHPPGTAHEIILAHLLRRQRALRTKPNLAHHLGSASGQGRSWLDKPSGESVDLFAGPDLTIHNSHGDALLFQLTALLSEPLQPKSRRAIRTWVWDALNASGRRLVLESTHPARPEVAEASWLWNSAEPLHAARDVWLTAQALASRASDTGHDAARRADVARVLRQCDLDFSPELLRRIAPQTSGSEQAASQAVVDLLVRSTCWTNTVAATSPAVNFAAEDVLDGIDETVGRWRLDDLVGMHPVRERITPGPRTRQALSAARAEAALAT